MWSAYSRMAPEESFPHVNCILSHVLYCSGMSVLAVVLYYTISEDQMVYTVNLKKIVEDFGYAHLNGIKFPWNAGGNICETLVVGKGTPTGVKEVFLKEVLNAQQYNLAGQKVNNNAKGLVIMNGKKYVK